MENLTGGLIKPGSQEEELLHKIDQTKLPVHIAVIMDGNGRWANQRNFKRIEGHRKGADSARCMAEIAAAIGIKYLTLFAFSSENWKRPALEVNALMNMLYEHLIQKKELLEQNNIRLRVIGNMERLPRKLKKKLIEVIELSKHFQRMQINLALNYGSRQEIIHAVQRMIDDGIPGESVNMEVFNSYLYTQGTPDPDMLIRTSGELRISNFLLFQIAYTELYFTDTLWPDFRVRDFLHALIEFQNRKRRFGKI